MSDTWRGLRGADLHAVVGSGTEKQVLGRLAERGLVHAVGEVKGVPVLAFNREAFDLFLDLLFIYRAQTDRSHLLHPQLRTGALRCHTLAVELHEAILKGSEHRNRLMDEGKCDEAGLPTR